MTMQTDTVAVEQFLSLLWPNVPLHVRRNMAEGKLAVDQALTRLAALQHPGEIGAKNAQNGGLDGATVEACALIADGEAAMHESTVGLGDDDAARDRKHARARTAKHIASRLRALPIAAGEEAFQAKVQPWLMACFGEMIAGDHEERNHRFLEEALELVQACGCTASEAHQLVDYVFGRPVGELHQEVGGVMVTLAALCLANDADMHAAGWVELDRIWGKVEQIRAKQAAKPKHSPLPEHVASPLRSTAEAGEEAKMPAVCDGIEQDAFEAWAEANRFVMDTHPLHWLFLNPETHAARDGWKAAIEHCRSRISTPPADLAECREVLEKCRDQFEFYAREHRAKAEALSREADITISGDQASFKRAESERRSKQTLTNQKFADMATAILSKLGAK